MSPILNIRNLEWEKAPGQPVFSNVNFTLEDGDFLVLTGKSGSGKSTMLKCLAHLNLYKGEIEYHGQSPISFGIPEYRTRVLYVPQRPALLPGSPRDFFETIHRFKSRQNVDDTAGTIASHVESAASIAENWGIEAELWDRSWASLSGGEAQRMALVIALAIKGTEVLLLDEPTSALDSGSVDVVEKVLKNLPQSHSSGIKAVICITHSEEQAARLATRRLKIGNGHVSEAHDV